MENENIFKHEKFPEIKLFIFMAVSKKILNYIFGVNSMDFTEQEKSQLRKFAIEILKTIEDLGEQDNDN